MLKDNTQVNYVHSFGANVCIFFDKKLKIIFIEISPLLITEYIYTQMTDMIQEHLHYWINQKRLYEENIKNNNGDISSMNTLVGYIDQRIVKIMIKMEEIKETTQGELITKVVQKDHISPCNII